MRRQGRLRRFLGGLPEESPLRDHVFLSFMSGRKPRKLDVSVPAMLRHILYPQGQPSLGLRTATAFTFAAIVSLAGLATMNARRPKTDTATAIAEASPTPTATPPVITAEQIGTPASGTSPISLPTVFPVSSAGSIPTVPNGAKIIVTWPAMGFDQASLRLEQWEINEPTWKLIGSRSPRAGRPSASVSFDNLPAGIFMIVAWNTNGSWRSLPIRLSDREVFQIGIGAFIPPSSAGEKIGVPECDDFLEKYDACVSSRVPEAARAQYATAINQWRNSWRKLASNPQNRGPLAAACKQAAQQQAQTLKAYGCQFGFATQTPTPTPLGQPVVLFDSWGKAAVTNVGPPRQFTISFDKPYFITQIQNYHWNDGKGASPGTISLRRSDGTIFGPWKVTATSGSGGAPNVNWECTPNVRIPAGTYRVVDSSPYTWSGNSQASDRGMTRIRGVPVP